jgi:hypothetical protein
VYLRLSHPQVQSEILDEDSRGMMWRGKSSKRLSRLEHLGEVVGGEAIRDFEEMESGNLKARGGKWFELF